MAWHRLCIYGTTGDAYMCRHTVSLGHSETCIIEHSPILIGIWHAYLTFFCSVKCQTNILCEFQWYFIYSKWYHRLNKSSVLLGKSITFECAIHIMFLLICIPTYRDTPLYFSRWPSKWHYSDVIMSTMASQSLASQLFVQPFVQQRKYQSSASLAFVRGIHR